MDLSIIFATYHSEEILQKSLECYCLIESNYQWELIIVDNAYREETRKVIDLFKDKLPIHFIEKSESGKNNALNKAIPHAKSDLIWFTDNDILPNKNLVDQYVNHARSKLDINIFGGKILPDRVLPKWIEVSSPSIKTALGILDLGDENRVIDADALWGGNMLIRKGIFDQGVRFASKEITVVNNHITGSETELLIRLKNAGNTTMYLKDSEVRHQIRDEQLTLGWLIKRAYNAGGGYVYNNPVGQMPNFFGMPRYLFKVLLTDILKVLVKAFSFKKSEICLSLMKVSNTYGKLVQFSRDRNMVNSSSTNAS
ncbi:glycosyltransferase family 2 protein [Colwellia sp. MB02u-6]|uniref:glycosyltransferase n=1 Tax=Colwellia sp. MB02u-6 TaxID=2759824 RepID=UPI0015F44771|nr:glycosyltransferase [Colwellia sp. MB02u-6]MBA6328718.1 glycosyltransferase family 2 protein [Colwellia sp. MB02u-6]